MKYLVTFEKYYTYEDDANSFDEAEEEAYKDFKADMRCPVADTSYDRVEVCLHEKFFNTQNLL